MSVLLDRGSRQNKDLDGSPIESVPPNRYILPLYRKTDAFVRGGVNEPEIKASREWHLEIQIQNGWHYGKGITANLG